MARHRSRVAHAWRVVAEWALGGLAVALVTVVAVRFDASAPIAALLYILAVISISLAGNLAAALCTALAATLCLDYFVTPPRFQLAVSEPIDVIAVVAFGTTALVVTRLLARLRKSEEQWRDVFENNPTMYFIVDAAGTVLSVNPFGAEQLGYAVDELLGRSVLRVFHDDDREPVLRHVANCLAHLGQSFSWELRKVRKDGSMLWVRETARAVLRTPKQPIILVACEDITPRKEAEEQLHRARAALEQARDELARVGRVTTTGELAASIAHEIRQPLAAVVINSAATLRWLNRGEPELDEARAGVERIVREAERAEGVIRGLRTLAQKASPRLSPIDLSDTIGEVLTLTQTELRRHRVSARTQLDEQTRRVVGDRVQLQQVLLNLIANALDAMSAASDCPRVLSIRSEAGEPDEVVVSVEDTGPGLDPATAGRAFDAFFTTKPGGIGLGLSVCRSIIDAHGGRLWVEPHSPHGATFRFTLPLAAE